jgi:hypothetical protein
MKLTLEIKSTIVNFKTIGASSLNMLCTIPPCALTPSEDENYQSLSELKLMIKASKGCNGSGKRLAKR